MKVKGFQGTSLLDFPGRIASLVFFGGCNLTCPFCHNPSLVLAPEQFPDYPRDELLGMLQSRIPFVDGVVISGGEPLLDPQCPDLVRQIRQLGLAVKLDTNGLYPEKLKRLLQEGLLDYVALDVKTAPGRYGELHTAPVDLNALQESVRELMATDTDYEIRTTCVPGFVAAEDIRAIGALVRGAKRWVLQQFVPEHSLDEGLRCSESYPEETLREFADIAGEYAESVTVRGI